MKYKVAQNIFEINFSPAETTTGSTCALAVWQRVGWHYDPFLTNDDENAAALLRVDVCTGTFDSSAFATLVFDNAGKTAPGEMAMQVRNNEQGDFLFVLTQPSSPHPNAHVIINSQLSHSRIILAEATTNTWVADSSFTSAMMLSYMLATLRHNTLVAHAAAIVSDQHAYLFIGKSGTGKSTHARQWLKAIPNAMLLNDDHPIVRFDHEGITVYGSPWSGKTDYYHNLSAPIGAIVRIKQAPHNCINRNHAFAAYASIKTCFSGYSWRSDLADAMHASLRKIVEQVPCYLLECLPNEDAARCCAREVITKE